MAKITIQIKKSYASLLSFHRIYVDDEKIGSAKNYEMWEFDISPGNHTLQIKSGWLKLIRSTNINFTINQSEEIQYIFKFTLFSKLFDLTSVITGLIVLGFLKTTSYLNNIPFLLSFFLPLLLVIIFLKYLLKNNFIKLEKYERFSIPNKSMINKINL
jgi:hypothetical protein